MTNWEIVKVVFMILMGVVWFILGDYATSAVWIVGSLLLVEIISKSPNSS